VLKLIANVVDFHWAGMKLFHLLSPIAEARKKSFPFFVRSWQERRSEGYGREKRFLETTRTSQGA
jgi:hypothetical protein